MLPIISEENAAMAFSEIFKDITSLQPEDTLQLVLEAKTEEERSFYEMIGDFLLQMK